MKKYVIWILILIFIILSQFALAKYKASLELKRIDRQEQKELNIIEATKKANQKPIFD